MNECPLSSALRKVANRSAGGSACFFQDSSAPSTARVLEAIVRDVPSAHVCIGDPRPACQCFTRSTGAVPEDYCGSVMLMKGIGTGDGRWGRRIAAIDVALGNPFKDKLSVVLYVGDFIGIRYSRAADALYVAVAIMWLIPDRRIEKNAAR